MAGYKGHIAGGLGAGVLLATLIPLLPVAALAGMALQLHDWQVLWGVIVVSILFGLFPDVDTNSKAQDIFFWLVFIVDLILIYGDEFVAAAYLGLIAMLPILGNHRGWTHSRLAMLLVPLPILIGPLLHDSNTLSAGLLFYAAAVAGYFSHLLLDGLIWKAVRVKG
jgi:membrane-bound metal-dependent hydrolase YbcI (DUF457 family)